MSSAEEAGRVAAEAATRFQNSQGAVAMDEARRAADEAQNLAQIASELEKAAIAEGTEDAKAAAEEAAKAAEQASEAARVAGEAAMAATEGIVARTAQEAPGKPPRKTPMSKPSALHVPPAPARKKPRRRRLKLRPLLVRLHLRRRRLQLDNLPRKPPEVQPQRRLNNRHCAILKDACRVARFHRRNSTRR